MNKDHGEVQSKEDLRRNTAIGFIIGLMLGGLFDLLTGDYGIGTILGMVLGSVIGYIAPQRVYLMEYPRRTVLMLILTGTLFFVAFFATNTALERELSPTLRVILAFVPILPGILFIGSIGYALSNLDEMQRRIQFDAIAIGFGITALATLTIGMLGMTGFPQPSWLLVPLIMTVAMLIGKMWTRWKYR